MLEDLVARRAGAQDGAFWHDDAAVELGAGEHALPGERGARAMSAGEYAGVAGDGSR